MRYNIKVGDLWLVGESATDTIKGTVRGDTTAVFSRMVGEMSAYDFADNRKEAASFDRITLCDYLRGIVERQNYGHYLGEIKVIPEDEVKAQLPKHGEWVEENRRPRSSQFVCSECHRTAYDPQPTRDKAWRKRCRYAYCPNCGAVMRKIEVQDEA